MQHDKEVISHKGKFKSKGGQANSPSMSRLKTIIWLTLVIYSSIFILTYVKINHIQMLPFQVFKLNSLISFLYYCFLPTISLIVLWFLIDVRAWFRARSFFILKAHVNLPAYEFRHDEEWVCTDAGSFLP